MPWWWWIGEGGGLFSGVDSGRLYFMIGDGASLTSPIVVVFKEHAFLPPLTMFK